MEKRHSIGTDPEFFVKNEEGKHINAEKLFPGTKQDPHPMKSGSGLQTDNVAVEFASVPARSTEELIDNIRSTFKEIDAMLPAGHELDATPTAEFDSAELQTEQAQKFGCDPSFCAWDLAENPQPEAADTNMRSTGGHIHVGQVDGDGNDFLLDPYGKINVVRIMDVFHGIISVILDNTPEAVKRRELYGSAGEHRPKDYGVEYRTLSAFWLKSPTLVMLMDSLLHDVLKIVREGHHNDIINEIEGSDVAVDAIEVSGENIRNIINTGDHAKAQGIIKNVLTKHMSEDSKHYLAECSDNINKYTLTAEWNI